MAHALWLVSDSEILTQHSVLTFRRGVYSYRIERRGNESIYEVADGKSTLNVPLQYAFGNGNAGQTYVYEYDGKLYESLVSFYKENNGLDVTIGDLEVKPRNVEEAAGRQLSNMDAKACFGCHTTNAIQRGALQLDKMIAGVACEHCHDSAWAHVDGFRTGRPVPMRRLSDLGTEEMGNFCGQCHRTWADIATSGRLGVPNVRFQPYRLVNSKCFDPTDARISCVACHNPHEEVSTDEKLYDAKCQACHGGGKASARACPRSKSNCVSCHMPKTELPGAHFLFTDHEIRIVRPGAPYPD